MKHILLVLLFSVFFYAEGWAQFPYGTTGLLHAPTADMQRDKTFMCGASALSEQATPGKFNYHTFNYYVNITFFPFLEVSYTCTLFKAVQGSKKYPEFVWGRYCNQDREFSVRLRLLKEGQFWKYMPAMVIGGNDVLTSASALSKGYKSPDSNSNGFWNRYYVALTKHCTVTSLGDIGIHLAYVYNRRQDYPLNGPCGGINYRPFFHKPLNLMAEYDSRTVNIGLGYSIWKDHINLVGELNECKYPSVGLYFKVHLK